MKPGAAGGNSIGSPMRSINAGDPYQRQIEDAVKLVVEKLRLKHWRMLS
jgi:protoheme ferro-lyase